MRLYAHTIYLHTDQLDIINELHKKDPNHDYILFILGLIHYYDYEDYKKSVTYFLQSAEYSDDEGEKINRLLYASKAYSKLGDYSNVLTTIEDVKKYKKGIPNFEEVLFKAMIEIYKIEDENEYFLDSIRSFT